MIKKPVKSKEKKFSLSLNESDLKFLQALMSVKVPSLNHQGDGMEDSYVAEMIAADFYKTEEEFAGFVERLDKQLEAADISLDNPDLIVRIVTQFPIMEVAYEGDSAEADDEEGDRAVLIDDEEPGEDDKSS